MTTTNIEQDLIQQLAAAQRASQSNVDATLFADVDRAAAYRIQAGVLAALNENRISVTPLRLDLTDEPFMTKLAAVFG